MAKTKMEGPSYGVIERFVYIFLIPAVFTLILSAVLLSLFGYDVKNSALTLANKIPAINKIIPDPEEAIPVSSSNNTETEEIDSIELNHMLTQKDEEISKLTNLLQQKDEQLNKLAEQLEASKVEMDEASLSDEQYQEKIITLANMYGDMMANKAALILQHLTKSELVLILSEMRTEKRVKVLEKMDPKVAAEASMLLKDVIPAKDLQIAALQERLQLAE